MSTETVTLAQYAKRHGVTRAAVGRWKARRVITMIGDLVDVAKSDAALAARPQTYRGGKSRDRTRRSTEHAAVTVKSAGLAAAIERKETALAELREFELAKKRSEYCKIETTRRMLEKTFAVLTEIALSTPGKIADECAMQPREIVLAVMQPEVNAMLEGMNSSRAGEIALQAAQEAQNDGAS
jgi:hypothetical protein